MRRHTRNHLYAHRPDRAALNGAVATLIVLRFAWRAAADGVRLGRRHITGRGIRRAHRALVAAAALHAKVNGRRGHVLIN
jgi:hypothetical protein